MICGLEFRVFYAGRHCGPFSREIPANSAIKFPSINRYKITLSNTNFPEKKHAINNNCQFLFLSQNNRSLLEFRD